MIDFPSFKKVLVFCSVITIYGCASGPTTEDFANADYGSVMTPAQCVAAVESRIRSQLKDPNSALFQHGSCSQGYGQKVPLLGMDVEFGYWQTGTVNAKNSFGGYVGARTYQALMKNGRIIRICISNEDGLCIPSR